MKIKTNNANVEGDVVVRVYPFKNKAADGSVASVSVNYGPVFVSQIRVKETDDNLSVEFPKSKGKDGKEYSKFWFADGTRENIIELIKDAYNHEVNGTDLSVTALPVDETLSADFRKFEKDNTLGFATLNVGPLSIYNIVLKTKKNAPDEAYLQFPQQARMLKGEHVLDNNGNWVFDSFAGPNSKEARTNIEQVVFDAYESADGYVEE